MFLLTPLQDASFDPIRQHSADPFQSNTASLRDTITSAILSSKANGRLFACDNRRPAPPPNCEKLAMQGIERDQDQFAAAMAVRTPVNRSVIHVYTYDPAANTDAAFAANAAVMNTFISRVATQEITMAPIYQPRPSNGTNYNVWTQDLASPVDAYSLTDYLGNFISRVAVDGIYARFLAIGSDFDGLKHYPCGEAYFGGESSLL
ncbi:hypothetical protein ACFQAT_08550 [Undibacterium arcticum]|uniref:hypothetical protein n=1 Tax=Undibacterium arcticum TaxID=1762892 RepID=UPI00361BA940